ncbi:MAG: hypothetical protein NDJ89_18370 [Oligoflexia bacterium]|nr:hypothetical protein [Oligoflexia bacterium]
MLNVIKEFRKNALEVRLVGTIEEDTDLAQLIGDFPGELHVNSKEVSRLSSHGVRHWIRYFRGLQERGVHVKHVACSSTIMQQVSFISNFIEDLSSIESVCVPYLCQRCRGQFVSVVKVKQLIKLKAQVPPMSCPKCGVGTARFDDIELEYFSFLNKLQTR